MNCKKSKGGVTTCTVACKASQKGCKAGRRSFTLHPNRDNTRAKKARGAALHRKYVCKRSKSTGRITSCALRRGKK